uniref:Desmoglein 2 n=1 Tax=Neogobius melanostomus TaxID=47308 RepID=A0A8C6WZB5_9GOBI
MQVCGLFSLENTKVCAFCCHGRKYWHICIEHVLGRGAACQNLGDMHGAFHHTRQAHFAQKPCLILQNVLSPQIRSDKENFTKVIYSLHGPGVDEPPRNRFGINSQTGYVKIYTILDREEIASYQLRGVATFINGTRAETDIPLPITVLDENDCTPVITLQTGSVSEASAIGTVVMRVIATDGDQANTLHSQMYYSLDQGSNSGGMFFLNSQTGEVMVQRTTLDRETLDTYKLTVRAADLNGQAGGNVGTGQIVIKILDINDNIPTLEREFYEASVEENTINVEVLRIKAIDLDMSHTDNSLAVYEITDGNQAGYFSITTDAKTNEGIIMINKALDFEELKVVNLEVSVRNKAVYNFGSSGHTSAVGGKGYPIKINVINQKEGPRFQPSVKVVTISEDHTLVTLNTIISRYAAIDTDTGLTATNVRYAKIYDQDNWLIIDENTADIKLNKLPDRESKFLINGTYYAKIICITNDSPSKTATGTIAIQVEDFNDHCPHLTATTQTLCFEDTAVYATAVDKDEFPNSTPFDFTVIDSKSTGQWTVEPFNETTVILRDHAHLWPGVYKVALEIKDQQGKACGELQVMDVVVCTCGENTKVCVPRTNKTVEFGPSGILMMLLGLLLLLLLPLLLLFCLCGGAGALGNFKAIPFDTKQQLIAYHTEGQGEDKVIHLCFEFYYGRQGHGGYTQRGTLGTFTGQEHYLGQSGAGTFDGMALSEEYLEDYYLSQSQLKDGFLVFDYEGQESLAGSVGCCSLLEQDNNLSFLDDLGPKFKKLAEICQGSAIVTDTVDAGLSISPPRISPPRPVSPVVPSTHTNVHTHSETIRDRERVNLSSSHASSGSSTLIQERLTGVPTQTLLIQQPAMYYAATPMYVVDPNPGLMQAGGLQGSQGVVLVDRQVGSTAAGRVGLMQAGGLQGSQGVVLVDRQVGSTVAGQAGQASSSRSHSVTVVEEGSVREQGAQGFTHSQQGSIGQTLEGTGQGAVSVVESRIGSTGSAGSIENLGLTPVSRAQGSQRVVVQRKKVSITESRESRA